VWLDALIVPRGALIMWLLRGGCGNEEFRGGVLDWSG